VGDADVDSSEDEYLEDDDIGEDKSRDYDGIMPQDEIARLTISRVTIIKRRRKKKNFVHNIHYEPEPDDKCPVHSRPSDKESCQMHLCSINRYPP